MPARSHCFPSGFIVCGQSVWKYIGQKGKVVTVALVVAMVTNSVCEANSSTSQLVKEWAQVERTTTVAGVYNNRSSDCSERGIEFTGLITLLFSEKELSSIKHAVDQVKIIQNDREISIVATDLKGKVVINKTYREGTDYSWRENELTITQTWDGGDEWESSKGRTLNSLVKSNGHLFVRSTNYVTRGLFGISSTKTHSYYFKFEVSPEA